MEEVGITLHKKEQLGLYLHDKILKISKGKEV